MPQTATLATPGTLMSLGRMVQRERTDRSMSDLSLADRPSIMTRLADEVGWSMTGAFEALVSSAPWVRRSCTTCRARIGSVPSSKVITTEDRPGIDVDCIRSTQAMPLSRLDSSGTVTRSSTSCADSPSASDCTSTVTGANSGPGSTAVALSWTPASTAAATASTATKMREPTPHLTILLTMTAPHADHDARFAVTCGFC